MMMLDALAEVVIWVVMATAIVAGVAMCITIWVSVFLLAREFWRDLRGRY